MSSPPREALQVQDERGLFRSEQSLQGPGLGVGVQGGLSLAVGGYVLGPAVPLKTRAASRGNGSFPSGSSMLIGFSKSQEPGWDAHFVAEAL